MVREHLSFRDHKLIHQLQGLLRLVLRLASSSRCGESAFPLGLTPATLAARAYPRHRFSLRRAPSSTGGWRRCLPQIDLERLPTETQGEFARRAEKILSAQGPASNSVSEVPREVVMHSIRFASVILSSSPSLSKRSMTGSTPSNAA